MKKILKIIAAFLAIPILFMLVFIFMNYAPDKSFEEIKEKWSYPNSQFLQIDGMPVHYRINGAGASLVLIHGTAASVHTWEKWTTILEKDFKVISLDMPAFGLTGPNKTGKYSLEYYAKFLDNFLTQIGEDTISMAGNSLGGGIAWTYTTLFPEKVKNLILVDASGYPSNKEPPLAFQLAQSPIWNKLLLTVTPKSLFEKSMKEVYHNDDLVTENLINRYYDLYLRKGNRQAFIDRVNNVHYSDASKIKTIKQPTLILWGETDKWVLLENAYKFQKDINNSELIVYPNAGHVPMEEIPEKTAEDVRNFLLKK